MFLVDELTTKENSILNSYIRKIMFGEKNPIDSGSILDVALNSECGSEFCIKCDLNGFEVSDKFKESMSLAIDYMGKEKFF